MSARTMAKIVGFGVLNFLGRFLVGGILFRGIKMDPNGFAFGVLLTLTALIVTYVLLRFVMKPASIKEAVSISIVWVSTALLLDVLTAQIVVGVSVAYLLSELQTWTRLLAIVAVAPFTLKKA
jgi:hypothetical protein